MKKNKELVWLEEHCGINPSRHGTDKSLAGAIFMHILELKLVSDELTGGHIEDQDQQDLRSAIEGYPDY